jgi:cytidine deaminase
VTCEPEVIGFLPCKTTYVQWNEKESSPPCGGVAQIIRECPENDNKILVCCGDCGAMNELADVLTHEVEWTRNGGIE